MLKRLCLIILAIILAPTILQARNTQYQRLWKNVQRLEDEDKPQSAYNEVQNILRLALAEKNVPQALCARMHAASLHQHWTPDSFFTDVAELEALRNNEYRPEVKAIYASILAEVYNNNSNRSQAHGLELASNNIKEWTREQYDSASLENWHLSLTNLQALSSAQSTDWLPFIKESSSSKYFRHDLLHVLWKRVLGSGTDSWRKETRLAIGRSVQAEYARLGWREAEILVALDLVDLETDATTANIYNYEERNEIKRLHLRSLISRYSDNPLCTEFYLSLINLTSKTEDKVELAQEALRRFPKYERITTMQELLNQLRQPSVSWNGNRIYYPGKTYKWGFTTRNTSSLTIDVYRLPDNFFLERDNDLDRKSFDSEAYEANRIRRKGQFVQSIKPTIHKANPYQEIEDSLEWTAPGPGQYAIVFNATTEENSVEKKVNKNNYSYFTVTSLYMLTRSDSDSRAEAVVVDAESGQPVEGAKIDVLRYSNKDNREVVIDTKTTDDEGRAFIVFDSNDLRSYSLRASADNDTYLPSVRVYRGREFTGDKEHTQLRLFTDRSIYRPGQTVHVSGIHYNQDHWDLTTLAGKDFELRLLDVNHKEVSRQTVKTDEMGVFATDFVLPESVLPGSFIINTTGAWAEFRVEEYKRPTFEVKMDEAPAVQWPQDSLTFTGKAIGFNGVPVRDGRVTGRCTFRRAYRWYFDSEVYDQQNLDTVTTDAEGHFAVRVPLKEIPADMLRNGVFVSIEVDALSPAGETQSAFISMPLCTTPLRVVIDINSQQRRDNIKAPDILLLSSSGATLTGEIRCSITHANSIEPLVKDVDASDLPAAMKSLPSGKYDLLVKARVDADTASAKSSFMLFGLDDKRLATHTPHWLYCPDNTFDTEHPATIQVGSSFNDVALYYTLVSKRGTEVDSLIRLSNELKVLEIPYREEYGDGLTISFAFVKNGECHTMNQSLMLRLPAADLKWQWTSFRDRLHPGDHETWTLRLTNPDGTPASANLMATIYDASLDQLYPHDWALNILRSHKLRHMSWSTNHSYERTGLGNSFYFPLRYKNVPGFNFDEFDSYWYQDLSYYGVYNFYSTKTRGRRVMKANALKGDAVEKMAFEAEAPSVAADEMVLAQSLETESADTAPLQTANPAIRTNFNETAAFLPHLHTDAKTGEVNISFNLPQSLTTWQLRAIAHTQDMKSASIQAQAIASKEMMAQLYLPRFLHAGDKAMIRASVQNLTDKNISGTARLEIFDPATERVLSRQKAKFAVDANAESILTFDYTPNEDPTLVAVRLTAESGNFADGEQHYLPILSSREWITESVEIEANGQGTFTTDLTSLFNNNSPTATNRQLTVEYTANPIWQALQALPALYEPKTNDVVSLTSAFYAFALASHIANTTPQLEQMVRIWKAEAATATNKTLDSQLQKNEELKQMILTETPWLRNAETDADRRSRLIQLFDENLQQSRTTAALDKLAALQGQDGGFSWFPGMHSSELMTRIVCIELTRLRSLTDNYAATSYLRSRTNDILRRAFTYIAAENAKMIAAMKKAEQEGVKISTASLMHLDYIYITQRAGVSLTSAQKSDVKYLLDHLKGNIASMSNDERALAAIVLAGAGRKSESEAYMASLREHMVQTPKHGTYFDYAGGSFTPTGHKIIIHTAAMEAFGELTPNDTLLMSQLRRWLLQQKRTQMWPSSICTTNAIYVLLHGNKSTLNPASEPDQLTLNYNRRNVQMESSVAGLGYVKQRFDETSAPNSITVQRHTSGEAWGAVYASYLTPISDAGAHSTGLGVRVEVSTTQPQVSDKLTTRYVITADRDYDYVCLRAERPACAEPAEQLSSYRYQGGLGFYRVIRDSRTEYFFDRLPKGTYVLEESSFIDRVGTYTTGLTTIQCHYAPEFGGNAEAKTINSK